MNLAIKERLSTDRPTDPHERVFWHIDHINLLRSCRWPPEHYEREVRELSDLITELYTDWLRARGINNNLPAYLLPVLPYVSFRFFSAPASKEVNIFAASSKQKARLIDLIVEDMKELQDTPFLRGVHRHSVTMLMSFLGSLRNRQMQ
jgi:hypothetical protein